MLLIRSRPSGVAPSLRRRALTRLSMERSNTEYSRSKAFFESTPRRTGVPTDSMRTRSSSNSPVIRATNRVIAPNGVGKQVQAAGTMFQLGATPEGLERIKSIRNVGYMNTDVDAPRS